MAGAGVANDGSMTSDDDRDTAGVGRQDYGLATTDKKRLGGRHDSDDMAAASDSGGIKGITTDGPGWSDRTRPQSWV